MSTEILKLTTEIVVSHASLTELSTEQLVNEIKAVYNVLSSLDGGGTLIRYYGKTFMSTTFLGF